MYKIWYFDNVGNVVEDSVSEEVLKKMVEVFKKMGVKYIAESCERGWVGIPA